jgi:hypothetical protein
MSLRKRKSFSGDFKAKVTLEAIQEVKTLNEIGQEFGVHPFRSVSGRKICRNMHRACLMPNEAKNRLSPLLIPKNSILKSDD